PRAGLDHQYASQSRNSKVSSRSVSWSRHAPTSELLLDELGVEHLGDPRYLEWLYDENPAGRAVEGNRDLDGRRAAHFAALPQWWRSGDRRERFVFSLNAITRASARGQGWFVELGEEIYGRAAESGHVGVITVCNANSTPALTEKLHQRFRGPLPVKVAVLVPGRGRGWRSRPIDTDFLDGAEFAEVAAELDDHRADGWTQCWTAEALRWRLARPHARYEPSGRGWLVNELNTMPGFTPISMYPKMWEASGLDYPDLIDELVDLAYERHARRVRNTAR
ncbi:MAG: hypothetical protein AAGK32_01155, partial [Actinomycetota bacterium]